MGKNQAAKYNQYVPKATHLCPVCRAYMKKGFCMTCYVKNKKQIKDES